MSTRFPHIIYVVGPLPLIQQFRQLGVVISNTRPDLLPNGGGSAERFNFSVPFALASNPSQPVAYGGGTGPINEALREYLEANTLAATNAAGGLYARIDNTVEKRVRSTNHAPTQARIDAGEAVFWDFTIALQNAGLVPWRDPALQLPG